MALFIWDKKFETGIMVIDDQHRKLVTLVNDLHDAMRIGKGRDAVGQILKALADYTTYHFTTEEKAFKTYGYSEASVHMNAHADFISKVGDLTDQYSNGAIALSVEILNFLVQWVSDHILKNDMQYVPLLKGKKII